MSEPTEQPVKENKRQVQKMTKIVWYQDIL